MGQAKLRGPRELRVEQSIQKAEEAEERRLKEIAEREAAMTPAEKRARSRARKKANMLLTAMMMIAPPPFK